MLLQGWFETKKVPTRLDLLKMLGKNRFSQIVVRFNGDLLW